MILSSPNNQMPTNKIIYSFIIIYFMFFSYSKVLAFDKPNLPPKTKGVGKNFITGKSIKTIQGDVFLLKVNFDKPPSTVIGRLEENVIPFVKTHSETNNDNIYEAIVGIDLSKNPEKYEIIVESVYDDGSTKVNKYNINVKSANFRVQYLKLPKEKVELDEETLKRVGDEKKYVSEILSHYTNEKIWNGNFIMPIKGEISHQFGSKRVINGEQKNPHTGEDIKAELGTPVHVSNDGIVIMVDDHFFSGKSIIVDHGLGIYTMYFHLSDTNVKTGDRVNKGFIIGKVGSTGRATGPHLHWGLRVNNARVNPISITRINLEQ